MITFVQDDMTTSKRTLHLPPNYSCIKRVSQQAIHFIDGLLKKKQVNFLLLKNYFY